MKILVIGLDAGTFDVMQPLLDAGKLPNLQNLIENGVSGELQSTYPPITPAAWTTFMTGKSPGKHGIFHFVMRKPNSYDLRFCTARDIHEPTLIDLFASHGWSVGSVNMPMTYPPRETNGYIVAGVPVPPGAPDITYPADLKTELDQLAGGSYHVEMDFSQFDFSRGIKETWRKYSKIKQMLFQMAELQHRTFLHLLETRPTDLFFAVYYLPDRVQHFFWKFQDKQHPGYSPEGAKRFGNVIAEAYQKMDAYIGELLTYTDENTTIYVMSDHGATGYYADLNLMYWLEQEGYLTVKRTPKTERVNAPTILPSLLAEWGIGKINRFLPQWFWENPVMYREQEHTRYIPEIDWQHTKAYATLLGISANLKGREPLGIIEPGAEYDQLMTEIAAKLRQITDPTNPYPLENHILRREEHCHGDHCHEFSDLFCVLRSPAGFYLPCERLGAEELFTPGMNAGMSGTHDFNGIFIMQGKNVRKSVKLKGLHIADVAPTMLYLAGYPILEDMDGTVMTAGIEEGYQIEHQIDTVTGHKQTHQDSEYPYTPEQQKMLEDSLRQLGYLE
ncbi:MAG: hypothetical protein D6675_15920 [Gemmatimonadetes bacterium]|nr:MAG: hypothetical protein D6675_15920 [Gemmatimonadota bacterium]